jgi:hypothetical protein
MTLTAALSFTASARRLGMVSAAGTVLFAKEIGVPAQRIDKIVATVVPARDISAARVLHARAEFGGGANQNVGIYL